MPEINPLTNNQIFLKKIAENTGSEYETGDVSEINPLTIDQIFLKEIAANTAGQSGDITELEGKVADNTAAIEAIENVLGAKNVLPNNATSQTSQGVIFTVNADGSITLSGSLQGVSYTGVNIAENYNIPIDCIMNGMPSNVPHVFLECVASDWSGIVKRDYGSGTYINASEFVGKSALVRIIVESGADLSTPVTIYPMIRDARITDPTYVPYSMTNRELTEKVVVLTQRIDTVISVNALKWTADILNVPSGYIPLSIEWNADTGYSAVAIFNTYMQSNNYYYLIFNPSDNTNYTYKGTMNILCVKA